MALCCSGCHLMALASAAGVLFHFLAWDFSDVAARTRGKAPGRYSVLPAQTCQHVNPQGTFHPQWGGKWGIRAALLGCILHSSYEHPAGLSPEWTMDLLPLFSVSFSALFPSYSLGFFLKINTFEKGLMSRSIFLSKARLRPLGLVSLP